METKLSARATEGQQWKVKATPITRKYGVDVKRLFGTPFEQKTDSKAWPGEIGTVRLVEWTAHDGSAMSGLVLEFARTRRTWVDTADLADFVKVRS